jgi:hypothetical protein
MSGDDQAIGDPLEELLGLSLADIATGIGYPQGTLRSYRTGRLSESDPTTAADIQTKLEELARLTRRLARAGSADPETLLICRLVEGYTATGWSLLHAGFEVALLDLAAGRDPVPVLNHYIPDWRERFWTDYEVFLASDGHNSIRRKRDAR